MVFRFPLLIFLEVKIENKGNVGNTFFMDITKNEKNTLFCELFHMICLYNFTLTQFK